jgi:tetratricopeptide (TPR) repeat protein
VLSNARHRGEYLLDRRREEREAEEVKEGRRALEAEIQFQKGDARLNQRRYEEALECFGKALELYPEEGEHHAHYGWALHLCHPGDPTIVAEAIEHVKRGLKLAPNREKSYLFMGRLCKVIGRAGAAEKMFTRAVQVQPDCVEALRELRLINMRRKSSKGVIGRLFGR